MTATPGGQPTAVGTHVGGPANEAPGGADRHAGASPGAAAGLQVAGEAFDVGAANLEQPHLMLLAPAGELAQVQRVRFARQAGLTGQEPSQGEPL